MTEINTNNMFSSKGINGAPLPIYTDNGLKTKKDVIKSKISKEESDRIFDGEDTTQLIMLPVYQMSLLQKVFSKSDVNIGSNIHSFENDDRMFKEKDYNEKLARKVKKHSKIIKRVKKRIKRLEGVQGIVCVR